MCYLKPGPRCSSSARQRLQDALQSGDALKIAKARQEYMLTPDGIQELKNKGRFETAEVMQAKRDELIAESKRSQASIGAGREISARTAEAYFEPNQFEKQDLIGYWSQARDRDDIMTGTSDMDAMYYDLNLYESYHGGEERLERTDFRKLYDKSVRRAERFTMENNPSMADHTMEHWTNARRRALTDQISNEAQVPPETTSRMITDWETGNRGGLMAASSAAFGGRSTYQPNNPAHRFLAAQYHRTQSYLKSQNVDTIRVYRNGNAPTADMTSCTLEEVVAQKKGDVYYADIPRESVVSLPQTGMGSVIDREVVLGPLNEVSWHSNQYEVDNPNGVPNGYHQQA